MSNCLLVASSDEKKGIKHFFKTKIDALKGNYGVLTEVKFDSKYSLYTIKLIYNRQEIKRCSNAKIRKIIDFISKINNAKSINRCVFANDIQENFLFKDSIQDNIYENCNGKFLYMLCINEIIYQCIAQEGITAYNLNVSIIGGQELNKILFLIDSISDKVKFLTIVMQNVDSLAKELDDRLYENGTSVVMSSDIKSAILDSDIVINLDFLKKEHITHSSKCVIINYGKLEDLSAKNNVKVINEIDIKFSRYTLMQLDKQIIASFKPIEIAEAILMSKECLLNDDFGVKIANKMCVSAKDLGYIAINVE